MNLEEVDTDLTVPRTLEGLLVHSPEFRALEAKLDVFCPFEALGVVGAEIRHSNYLSYILNPHRPHGFGDGLLRPFLMEALRAGAAPSTGLTPLDIHLIDLGNVEIRREWENIDLLITVPQARLVVAMELKIEAQQAENQLKRYRERVDRTWPEDEWRKLFIFLTKHEEKPHDDWIPVRLSNLVKVIDDFLPAGPETHPAYQTLRAYSEMIKRHHMENEELAKLAGAIWSRHSEALLFLMNHQPDVFAPLFASVVAGAEEIAEKASATSGLTIVQDDDQGRIIRFAVEEWDVIPGFLESTWTSSKRVLLFELKFESDAVRGYLYIGPGSAVGRRELLDALAC